MIRLLTVLFFAPVLAFAQFKPDGRVQFSPEYSASSATQFRVGKVGEVSDKAIRDVLKNKVEKSSMSGSLYLMDSIRSPAGWHFNYQQQYNGINIFGAGVKVNISNDLRIRSIVNGTVKISENPESDFPQLKTLSAEQSLVSHASVYFPVQGQLIPCMRMVVREQNFVNYEIIVDASGEVLYIQDLNRYFAADSTVAAKVFLPDPLTSAGQVYGGVYADNGDADNAALNDERYDVTMVVDFANDTFRLTSPLVEIQNFSNPVTTIAISTVPNFDFTRTQKEFEDVNCFYHLTTFQNYMQSLGFALVNYQLGVDAHALNGADNSMFNFPRLYFGDGCVDDAEDADVIIHEYGHAITASAAPNTWIGSERKALDEGAGDYLATSYTRMLNSFNWELMFGWDGHSSACWPGRTAATTKQYPAGLTGDIHADGEIWSSTLMQIWEVLGRETTDQIFLQSLYSYAQNISMTDAAYMFLDADSLLNGGANYVASYYWFEKRGILPPLPFFSGTDGNGDMATCPGSCDASVVAIPISGVAPYTYLWKDSAGTTLSQITDTITGLCPGNYTAFITDATGDTVTVNIAAREPGQLSIANSVVNESCSFCSDGTVSARVTGGNPPYSYQWNDPSGQTTRIATGLDSGYYQVSIVDVNGCTYLDSALVEVDSPTEFGLGFSSVSDPLCIGACSGSIQVVAYLGLPPYTYLWSTNGAETTSMVTDLCEGTYGVTISDSNGDSIVGSTSLSEPSAMTHTISTTADSGNFGGTASVVVTNGAAPLTYSWSDTGTQTTATATGLAAGEYSVTWEDANGCTGSALDTVDFYMAVYEDVPGEVSIFPNPTTGRLYIRSSVAFGELHIHIANLLGQTVYESNVQHGGQIDISNYKPGLYSITLTNDKAIMLREKLILL